MILSPDERRLFTEIERRKADLDDPCESCDGTGLDRDRPPANWICSHCLGQGILLNAEEYEFMRNIVNSTAGEADASDILAAEYLI
jgi:DnaJ-class molecular chaperone